jgi:hypothetical protein
VIWVVIWYWLLAVFRPVAPRAEKMQGTLLKCVGELVECKSMLRELEMKE